MIKLHAVFWEGWFAALQRNEVAENPDCRRMAAGDDSNFYTGAFRQRA
jgi:hypothetical protein